MIITIAATAAIAGMLASAPSCKTEDGSDMLYTTRYSLCTWNEPAKPNTATKQTYVSYWVSIDRQSETAQGAYLTYTMADRLTGRPDYRQVPDRVWTEK